MRKAYVGILLSSFLLISLPAHATPSADLLNGAFMDHPDAVVKAVREGAGLEEVDEYGYSPLIWASANGDLAMVRYLLAKGASTSVITKSGDNAEEIAKRWKHDNVASALSSHDAMSESEVAEYERNPLSETDSSETEVSDSGENGASSTPQPIPIIKKKLKLSPIVYDKRYSRYSDKEGRYVVKELNDVLKTLEVRLGKGIPQDELAQSLSGLCNFGAISQGLYPPAYEKTRNILMMFKSTLTSSDFQYAGAAVYDSIILYVNAGSIDFSTVGDYTLVSFQVKNFSGSRTFDFNMFLNQMYLVTTSGRQVKYAGLSEVFSNEALRNMQQGSSDALQYPDRVLPESTADFTLAFPGSYGREDIAKLVLVNPNSVIEVPFFENQ